MSIPELICSIEGCESMGVYSKQSRRYYLRNGMCANHNYRFKRYGDPLYVRKRPVCKVEDCKNFVNSFGLCEKHYFRFKKYGDASIVKKIVDGERSKHSIYQTYHDMKTRCLNPKSKFYEHYGGRGIEICDRWLGVEGFDHFKEDLGERPPKHSLDRIDNNGNYEPSNCRWADAKTQANNRRPAQLL